MEKKSKLIKECDSCESNASCLCFKCKCYYCDSCFKKAHVKSTKSNHKMEKLDIYVPIDLYCQAHPDFPLNLFCVEEKGKLYLI